MQINIRILSKNVGEANDCDKRKVIKSLVKSQRMNVVNLQETKLQRMSNTLVHSLGVGRCPDWRAINLKGEA